MMSLRPYYAVAHVASQISGRYLPVNLPSGTSSLNWEPNLSIETWSPSHWDWFLRTEREQPSNLLPWLNRYLSRFDSEATILLSKLNEHFQWCRSSGAHYVLLCDILYPELLKQIPQAPLALTLLGDLDGLKRPKVSVVGSRRTANVVLQESYRLGYLLACHGVSAVSGGAFGCDVATHEGVLSAGKTPLPAIVVFANGLDQLYPRGNAETFSEILRNGGLLVSERLWDQVPKPYDFPTRNRIISGLSMWTLVMGATHKSGAMITARFALDQGREVSVFLPDSSLYFCEGGQSLIDDGAASFVSAEDLCQKLLL